jgi:hypothetical protein
MNRNNQLSRLCLRVVDNQVHRVGAVDYQNEVQTIATQLTKVFRTNP